MERVTQHIRELQQVLDQLQVDAINQVITILHKARLNGRHVYILGVGSSAAIASQFVDDLCKISRQRGLPGFKAIGLTESTLAFSPHMEGEDADTLFAHQLDNLLSRGDVLFTLSISGNAKVVHRAVELANRKGAITIGFIGGDEGRIASVLDVVIRVPTLSIEYIEDTHLILQNLITQVLREDALQISSSMGVEHSIPKTHPAELSSLFRSLTVEHSGKASTPERSRIQLELLTELSKELAYDTEPGERLRRVLQLTLNKLHASRGTLVVLNEHCEAIQGAMVINGEDRPYTLQQYAEIIERGLAGWVVRNRQGALILNTKDDPRWLPRTWDEGSRSALCVPLIENDRVFGILTLITEQVGGFSQEDLSLLAAVTMFITLINFAL